MKYRIWDKEDNRYRYDSFINQKGYVCKLGVYDYETPCVKRHNPQDRFVIELSTGLLDKNGVEIYENDNVLFEDEKYQVEYNKYMFSLKDFYNTSYDTPSDAFSELFDNSKIEIIGTIHDTPREGE
jgi:hypothetical protein